MSDLIQLVYQKYEALYAMLDQSQDFAYRKSQYDLAQAYINKLPLSVMQKLDVDLMKSGYLGLWLARSRSTEEQNYVQNLRGMSDVQWSEDMQTSITTTIWQRIESLFPEARKYTVELPSGNKDMLGSHERDQFDQYVSQNNSDAAIGMLQKLRLRSWTPALTVEKFQRTSITYDLPTEYLKELRIWSGFSPPSASSWDSALVPQVNTLGKIEEASRLLRPYMSSKANEFFNGSIDKMSWLAADLVTLFVPGRDNELWYASLGYFHRRLKVIMYAKGLKKYSHDKALYVANSLMYAMCLFPNDGNDMKWYRTLVSSLGWTLDQLLDINFDKRTDFEQIQAERESEKRATDSFVQGYIDQYAEKSRIEGQLLKGPFAFFGIEGVFNEINKLAEYALIALGLYLAIKLVKSK